MNDEKERFQEYLNEKKDPIEQWPIAKLKKEASGDGELGKAQERDEIGIE